MNLRNYPQLIEECKKCKGAKTLIPTIRKFGAEIQPLIQIVWDPYQKFHVTGRSLTTHFPCTTPEKPADSLYHLLTGLVDGSLGSGNNAINVCLHFIEQHSEFKDIILKAIDKDFKIRVGSKLLNKAFPMLIPEFSCALGYHFDDHQTFFADNMVHFLASRKLDGVRCIFVCRDGVCTAMSRSGHEYPRSIPGLALFLDNLAPLFDEYGIGRGNDR